MLRKTAKSVNLKSSTELNIGVMCTIGPSVLTAMLEAFQEQREMVSLVIHDVTLESIPTLLLSGALDGAFCARVGPAHPQLRYVDLFAEAMVVAFPNGHRFSEFDSVPLHEVARERYVDRLHCEFRQGFYEFCSEKELRLDVVFRSQREDWIQSLIRDGVGVSVMPRYSLLRPELDFRPIVEPPLSRQVELATLGQAQIAPALQMLTDQAREYRWKLQQP